MATNPFLTIFGSNQTPSNNGAVSSNPFHDVFGTTPTVNQDIVNSSLPKGNLNLGTNGSTLISKTLPSNIIDKNVINKPTQNLTIQSVKQPLPNPKNIQFLDRNSPEAFDNTTAGIVMNTLKGIPESTLNVAKDIGQGIARTVGTVEVTAGNQFMKAIGQPPVFPSETITNEDPITNAIFGGQPVRDLTSAARNAENKYADVTGYKPDTTKTPYLGYGLAIGGIFADLSGFGGGKTVNIASDEVPEAFLKHLAKNDAPTIEKTLIKIGTQPEDIKALTPLLGEAKTVNQVKQVLIDYEDVRNATKASQENPFKQIFSPETKPVFNEPKTIEAPTSFTTPKYKVAENPYQGETDLTTNILKDLQGKTTVSKQYILDATNRPELKQVEKDLTRQVLDTMPGNTVDVNEFADKVKSELLPLKVVEKSKEQYARFTGYEGTTLDSSIRGNVSKYKENIYESPIKTSAGEKHYPGDTDNYFGHTRIEDMADETDLFNSIGKNNQDYYNARKASGKITAGGTRRVIEVQSDLYQKGNLEKELTAKVPQEDLMKYSQEQHTQRAKERIAKLRQYNDPTAHFRMVREEIKKASEDGKTKLQFPTGETAMKIEGLGGTDNTDWMVYYGDGSGNIRFGVLSDSDMRMKVGHEIYRHGPSDAWIITDVLGDGKFKAVPKNDNVFTKKVAGTEELAPGIWGDSRNIEEFDISGKVDTNNPIYKFYEKDLGRYLKNKYNAKTITDSKGVNWYEVDIKPEMKGAITAFKFPSNVQKIGNKPIVYNESVKDIQSKLNKIFGKNVPIETVLNSDTLSNKKAIGESINGVIKLLEENKSLSEAVANHEGWHWFKQSLNKAERERLTKLENEFASLPENQSRLDKYKKDGYRDDELAEELMADEFSSYTSTGKTFSDKVKAFFDRLWTTLKNLFSKKGEVIKEFRNVKETLKNNPIPKEVKLSLPKSKIEDVESKLMSEAKKYKSAEEFVKAQGTPVYHGTTKEAANKIEKGGFKIMEKQRGGRYTGDGVYFSPEDYHASRFAGSDGKTLEAYLNTKNYKTVYLPEDNIDWQPGNDLVNEWKTKYDGVILKSRDIDLDTRKVVDEWVNEIVAFKPEQIKTKSQLTDIWNKANSTKLKIGEGEYKLSEADRLMAEGKIRIVSRNGYDTYQIKKGGNWVNVRDEESAVKQLTEKRIPTAKEYSPVIQDKLAKTENALDNVRTQLAEHPAKPLLKFNNNKEGEFLDFRSPNTARTPQEAERIKERNAKIKSVARSAFQDTNLSENFDSADTIREVMDEYKSLRQKEKNLIQERNSLSKNTLPKVKPLEIKSPLPQPKISQLDTSKGEGRSIEIASQQAESILQDKPVEKNVSLPDIISKTVTPVQNKVHVIDTFLRTPKFVMEKIGFGKEAKALRDAMDKYWKELPVNLDKITQWSKEVPKESNQRIFKWLDGEAIDLNTTELKVGNEIKTYLKEWAVKLDLPSDKTVSHYITHLFDKELITKEFDEELAKIIADRIPGSVYDPFLLKRLGTKGYKQDTWAALDAYVKRATRKVNLDPVLEDIQSKTGATLDMSKIEKSQFEYIKKYIDNINMRPSEADEGVDNFIKSIIGYKFGQRPVATILRRLRQMTFRGALGLNPASALRNLSQGANTYAELGEKYTVIGYAKLFSKGAGQELKDSGVLNAGFVQDRALSSTKKLLEKTDKVLFSLFETAEHINRGAAYFGAKAKGINQGMSEQEAIDFAKEIVHKTQFVFDSVDTPVGMSSDIMKTLLQFQSFTTKQIEFLGGKAKGSFNGDEKLKNALGLLRYALAGLVFTYTIGEAFGMKPQELLPWYRFETPVSLKFPVEVGKALMDSPNKYGQARSTTQKLKDTGNSAVTLFPAGSQIKKTYQGIQSINQGGSFTSNGNLQFPIGKTNTQKAQAILFGKYANNDAQNYFKQSDTKIKETADIIPIYDKIQQLISEGKQEEALQLYNQNITDTKKKEIYKSIKIAKKTSATNEGKNAIIPIYQKIQKLKVSNPEEALKLYNGLSDDQKKYYQLIKKQFDKTSQ